MGDSGVLDQPAPASPGGQIVPRTAPLATTDEPNQDVVPQEVASVDGWAPPSWD